MRSWNLAETNYGFTKENRYEVAVLPLGATEPHNLHLPYGTDSLEGTIIGENIYVSADRQNGRTAEGKLATSIGSVQNPQLKRSTGNIKPVAVKT